MMCCNLCSQPFPREDSLLFTVRVEPGELRTVCFECFKRLLAAAKDFCPGGETGCKGVCAICQAKRQIHELHELLEDEHAYAKWN